MRIQAVLADYQISICMYCLLLILSESILLLPFKREFLHGNTSVVFLFSFFEKIIASANFMLSELFQLDEPKKEDNTDFPINGNSDESYSEEEEEMPDSDENGSYSNSSDPPDDNKAVAIIKSVGELSVPEKYKSVHRIRVSKLMGFCLRNFLKASIGTAKFSYLLVLS